jgi:hypothetical protein
MGTVIDLATRKAARIAAKQGTEVIEQGAKAASKGVKGTRKASKKMLDDIDNGLKDLEILETMSVDDKLRSRMEKNLSKKQKKRDAAVNKQRRTNEYNNNVLKSKQKRLDYEKTFEAKRLSDLEKSYDGVFDDNNIVFKRKDVINNDGTFNASKADDYYHEITNKAVDFKREIKDVVDMPMERARKIVNEEDILNSKVVNGGTSNIKASSQTKKNQQGNPNPAGDAATKNPSAKKKKDPKADNWVYKAAAAGVGGGLVLSMSNSRGQQSNQQLYGQGGY